MKNYRVADNCNAQWKGEKRERKRERGGGGGWRNDPWIERVAILTWLHFRYDYYCAISGRVHGRTGRTRTNFQRERMKIDFHISPNHPPFPLLSSFRTNAHRYVCQISIRNIDARSKILNLPVLVFLFFFFPFFSLLLYPSFDGWYFTVWSAFDTFWRET